MASFTDTFIPQLAGNRAYAEQQRAFAAEAQQKQIEYRQWLDQQQARAKLLGLNDPKTGITWDVPPPLTAQQAQQGQPPQQTAPIMGPQPSSGMPGHGMYSPIMGPPQQQMGGLMGPPPAQLTPPAQANAQDQQQLFNRAYPDLADMNARWGSPVMQSLGGGGSASGNGATIRQLLMLDPTGKQAAEYIRTSATPGDKQKLLAAYNALPDGDPQKTMLGNIFKHEGGIETDTNKIAETKASIDEKNSATAKNTITTGLLKDAQPDDPTVDRMAGQIVAGQPPSQVIGAQGRGPGGQALVNKVQRAVTAKWALLHPEDDGAGLAAKTAEFAAIRSGMVANEKFGANIVRSADEMSILGDQLQNASAAVDRVGWTDLNQLTNFAKSHTSNPEYGQLDVAVQGFKTAFGQALSRNGVPTDKVREKSDALFSGVRNHADLMGRVAQAKLEASGVIQAQNNTAAALKARIGGAPPAAAAPAAPTPGITPVRPPLSSFGAPK